jgi:hypothetical protein
MFLSLISNFFTCAVTKFFKNVYQISQYLNEIFTVTQICIIILITIT